MLQGCEGLGQPSMQAAAVACLTEATGSKITAVVTRMSLLRAGLQMLKGLVLDRHPNDKGELATEIGFEDLERAGDGGHAIAYFSSVTDPAADCQPFREVETEEQALFGAAAPSSSSSMAPSNGTTRRSVLKVLSSGQVMASSACGTPQVYAELQVELAAAARAYTCRHVLQWGTGGIICIPLALTIQQAQSAADEACEQAREAAAVMQASCHNMAVDPSEFPYDPPMDATGATRQANQCRKVKPFKA